MRKNWSLETNITERFSSQSPDFFWMFELKYTQEIKSYKRGRLLYYREI